MTWQNTRTPLLFLLCMTAVGLKFYPALAVMFGIMAASWRRDRYSFLVQLMIAYGGFLFYEGPTLSRTIFMLPVALFGFIMVKKTPMIKKALWAETFYFAALCIVAWKSLEPISHQIPVMSNFLTFCFFVIPLMIFSGREFSFEKFFRTLFPYTILVCVFYCLDYFIFSGFVMLPFAHGSQSVFWDLDARPFHFLFRRINCFGLYLLVPLIFPVSRGWKLPKWCWLVVVGALAASQTFTLITGLIFGFIISQGSARQYFKYILIGTGFFVALYAIDLGLAGGNIMVEKSPMRVVSQVNQIIGFGNIQDEEDLARAGSDRMAQALPKLELIDELDMEMFGFGFLHPEHTTNDLFYIHNPFYIDVSQADELATGVEITAIQLYLNMGIFGVVCHVLWLWFLWMIVRKKPMAKYFLCVVAVFLWLGIGGYSGMIQQSGQLIASVVFAGILLRDEVRPVNREAIACGAFEEQAVN